MKLYGVRVWVDDMAAAKVFYGEVLGLAKPWDMEIAAGFDLGGAQLIVEQASEASREEGLLGRFVGVSINVDDIQATYDALMAKGVEFQGPPEKMPWGGTLAHFRDPAGNVLTLMT